MRLRWALAAFGMLLGSVSTAQALQVSITAPQRGDIVLHRDIVAGRVSSRAPVWVVIHPLAPGERRYWVQPRTTVRRNGLWRVLAYFAEPSPVYQGLRLQVRACARPRIPLSEGQIFYGWPPCSAGSRIVVVTRG
jgi:hypothetical protein